MSQRLLLSTFHPEDDHDLMSWFPDAAALRQFAGTTLQWPLTRSQLDAIRADPAVRAWTGWTNGVPARRVAHAELVRLDDDRFLLARVAVLRATGAVVSVQRCYVKSLSTCGRSAFAA